MDLLIYRSTKLFHITLFLVTLLLYGCVDAPKKKDSTKTNQPPIKSKPTVSFTFDDGITNDIVDFKFEEWNEMILSHLSNENLKAVFFVTGRNKLNEKGQFLLQRWNDAGHRLANHSFAHPSFYFEKNNATFFEGELLKTDAIISKFSNALKLFRFPYLKEGSNALTVDSIRSVLTKHNYSNGYVTIDASDWYVNQRLIERIKEVGNENAQIEKFKDFYLEHIMERAKYYEKLSYELNGRHIDHTLLLHHNLTSALFLGDLIQRFKEEGWNVVDAEKAFQDPIFKRIPEPKFAGESLIYSLAKQSGNYGDMLRYPAEDSQYERKKMNQLGL